MAGEEQGESQGIHFSALEIDQLIGLFISVIAEKAWQYMGYRITPGKDEAEKDLAKAATAIDCVSFLAEKIAPYIEDKESRMLESLIADLKINYTKVS